jgi:hypothetical protein
MIETPILVVLLFGLGALSICGMVIFAASMRVMMPPQIPDMPMPELRRYDARTPEYGRPVRPLVPDQLYQNSNQQTNSLSRPTPGSKEKS